MKSATRLHSLPRGNPQVLCSPIYLCAVGLLLLNDFFFKQRYPGLITGKLSDFAGLFAIAVLFLVVHRTRWILCALALAFIFWKSALSQTLIDSWNAIFRLQIGRTVDPTDLIALIVLPLAWSYQSIVRPTLIRRDWCVLSCLVSLFAFVATSTPPTPEQQAIYDANYADFAFTDTGPRPRYTFPFPPTELHQRLEPLGMSALIFNSGRKGGAITSNLRRPNAQTMSRKYPPEFSWATFDLEETNNGITIILTKITITRGNQPSTRNLAVELFKQRVVKPLQGKRMTDG